MTLSPNLPIKLTTEPLIDAVFEARFAANLPLSSVLPGYLFRDLGDVKGIEALPASQLPKKMRDADPNLAVAPLARLGLKDFLILVSDTTVAVACRLPYAGWTPFREAIVRTLASVRSSGFAGAVSRYSMKYVDLFDTSLGMSPVAMFDWSLRLGPRQLDAENIVLRVEAQRGIYVHAISIATQAQVQMIQGDERNGAILDVDLIHNLKSDEEARFWSELPERLNAIHLANKQTFFECLSQEGLTKLGPVYG